MPAPTIGPPWSPAEEASLEWTRRRQAGPRSASSHCEGCRGGHLAQEVFLQGLLHCLFAS